MIKINQLKYFLSVIENKSFNLASSKLNISQPAISKAIKELEENLSTKLIDRFPKGIKLTESGKILMKYAYLVTSDLDKAEDEIKSLKQDVSGILKIGVGFSPRMHLLPKASVNLQNNYPNIRLTILANYRKELINSLIKGEIDFAISEISPIENNINILSKENEDLNYLRLYKDTLHLITKNDHPLQLNKFVSLKDTLKYSWIMPNDIMSTRLFRLRDAFLKHNLSPPIPKIMHNSGNFSLNIIKQSNYIGIHPKQMIDTANDNLLKILEIKGLKMERVFGITYLKSRTLTDPMKLMIKELKIISKQMILQEFVKNV